MFEWKTSNCRINIKAKFYFFQNTNNKQKDEVSKSDLLRYYMN